MKVIVAMLFLIGPSKFASSLLQKTVTSVASQATTSTTLKANFLESLQRSFSVVSPGSSMSKYYTIGITGASGLVGTALRDELSRKETIVGKPIRIVKLERSTSAEDKVLEDKAETSLKWNPNGSSAIDVMSPTAVGDIDAIVHLAGENVATGLGPLGFLGIRPWTDEKKAEIMNSRVIPTQALSKVLAASNRPKTFLAASGVGVYGDKFVDESSAAVDETMNVASTGGFLAEVSRAWEAATQDANKSSNRVVNMRFGVVLSTKGGALAKLYPIFFLGGGGDVGSGKQYFSFISARDIARAIVHTLETPSLKGPVNVCAPNPCTNAEFTKALGGALTRPTILPLPSFVVSLMFGEMGEEMLLGGVRSVPTKLLRSGFQFLHPTIDAAIKSALEEKI